MKPQSRGVIALVAAGLCGAAIFAVSLSRANVNETASVESLLPADTVVYINWDGTDKHRAAWEKTAAYEAAFKSGLMHSLYETVESLVPGNVRPDFDLAMKTLETILQRGLTLAVDLDDVSPAPHVTLVLHNSADLEETLEKFLQNAQGSSYNVASTEIGGRQVKVLRSINEAAPGGWEVGWWKDGGHLVLVAGFNAVQSAIDVAAGKSKNITTNAVWTARGAKSERFETIGDAWIDMAALRGRYGQIPLPMSSDPAAPPVTVNNILEALGLHNLGTIGMRTGIKERAMWSEVVIEAPKPRTGLLALANQQSLTLNDLPPIPPTSPGFMVASFDWSQAYDAILKVVKDTAALENPQNVNQVDQVLDRLSAMLQFDLKKGLLDPLGHVNGFFADAGQGPMGFGFGIAISVDDAESLRISVDKLIQLLQNAAGPNLQVGRSIKYDREIVSFQFGGGIVNPALCIDDKWLVLALAPQSVDTFLMRLDGKLPRWKPTEEHTAALNALPKEFISLSISDPRASMQGLLTMANTMGPAMLAGFRQAQRDAGGPPTAPPAGNPLANLPPAEIVTAPLFPNVSVCTVDDRGVVMLERTSMPSVMSVGAVPGVAVGVALLLPAVQQAREAARRTQSKNNLKQIGLAMHNYHDVYNAFPQGAHPNDKLAAEKRLSWLAEILPFVEQKNLYDTIDFKKSWDDDANKASLQTMLPIYLHPSLGEANKDGYPVTHYVGFAGLGKEGPTLPVDSPKAGIFAYNRATRMRDILDGTSNTACVAETAKNLGSWGAAGPATIRPATQKPYINGPDGFGGATIGGMNVLFSDGSVRFLSNETDSRVIEAIITIRGGESLNNLGNP